MKRLNKQNPQKLGEKIQYLLSSTVANNHMWFVLFCCSVCFISISVSISFSPKNNAVLTDARQACTLGIHLTILD